MRRLEAARLTRWKTCVTPVLLLWLMLLFNSASTAGNSTDVSPLLALIASLRHRPDGILAQSSAAPRDAVVRPQLEEWAPLMVGERLRSVKRRQSKTTLSSRRLQLQFPDSRDSQPQDALASPRAFSRLRRLFFRVAIRTVFLYTDASIVTFTSCSESTDVVIYCWYSHGNKNHSNVAKSETAFLYSPGDSTHLTQCVIGPHKRTCQMASESVECFN